MVFAYSPTASISIEPAMFVPQWQMKTPTRGFSEGPVFTGAAAPLAAGACFGASCFFASVFLVVVFFFSAIIPTSQHLLQERFAADPMEIQPEVLRAHSLCQSK